MKLGKEAQIIHDRIKTKLPGEIVYRQEDKWRATLRVPNKGNLTGTGEKLVDAFKMLETLVDSKT